MKEALPLFKQYALRVWDVDPTGKPDEEIASEITGFVVTNLNAKPEGVVHFISVIC